MDQQLRSFDQDSIEVSNQISLYSKLIDIIDKDVDDIRNENSRAGLSIWGILAGIVGGTAYIFGITSKLTSPPNDAAKVACASLIFLYFILAVYNNVSGNVTILKPGRLMSTRDFFRERILLVALRFITLLVLSFFLVQSDFSRLSVLFSIVLVFIPPIYLLSVLLLMIKTGRPFGNNLDYQKSSIFGGVAGTLCLLIPTILLVSQLSFPVGDDATNSYAIGLTISVIIFLFEILFSISQNSSSIGKYLDLKDDLILRNIGLKDALNRYRILREGKSSWDELEPDFKRFQTDIEHRMSIHDQQLGILSSQESAGEPEWSVLSQSFMVHVDTLQNTAELFTEKFQKFDHKVKIVFDATGDRGTDNYIRQRLTEMIRGLQEKESEVARRNMAMFQKRPTLTDGKVLKTPKNK